MSSVVLKSFSPSLRYIFVKRNKNQKLFFKNKLYSILLIIR